MCSAINSPTVHRLSAEGSSPSFTIMLYNRAKTVILLESLERLSMSIRDFQAQAPRMLPTGTLVKRTLDGAFTINKTSHIGIVHRCYDNARY